MKVGWLADPGTEGGAELTQQEFRDAAPDDVEIVDMAPGEVNWGVHRYIVHNCISYTVADLQAMDGAPVFKYVHDLWPHGDTDLRSELIGTSKLIFCSPLHRERFDERWTLVEESHLIPPPVDLDRFRKAAESAGDRAGAVSIGSWMNWGKSPHLAQEAFPEIDFYGDGPCKPQSSEPVAYADVPELLAKYETFVHLPSAVEPFGRSVVEAHYAGCDVVTNALVGARYWIEEAPNKLESAASDFWSLVCQS